MRPRAGHLFAVALLAILVTSSGTTVSGGVGCRSFGGSLDLVQWSADGTRLVAGSRGDGRILLIDWPSLTTLREISSGASGAGWSIDGGSAAIDAEGRATWMETNVFDGTAAVWRFGPDGGPQLVGYLPHPRFLDFFWTPDGLLAVEWQTSPDEARLVRLVIEGDQLEQQPLTDWGPDFGELWVSRDGRFLVYDNAPNPSKRRTVLTAETPTGTQAIELPGYGGSSGSLTPDGRRLVYRETETSHFVTRSLVGNQDVRVLSPTDYYAGEISAGGLLAAVTVELTRFGGHPESRRHERPMGVTDAEPQAAIPARVPL